jgi:hypothetical protein
VSDAAAPERTALYRIFGDEDLLLYIGITKNFGMRWQKHSSTQPWWPQLRRQTIDWYDSRPEARAAELAAIHAEQPVHNKYDRFGPAPTAERAAGQATRAGTCLERRAPCQRRPISCSGETDLGYPCLLLQRSVPPADYLASLG